MKIKDITISIFAIIGFVAILSSFNNQSQETHSTVPESHAWEFHINNGNGGIKSTVHAFAINKITGEVRKYETQYTYFDDSGFGGYDIGKQRE